MENIFLFYSGIFFFSFLLGKILEKMRIPWLFSGIFVGLILSFSSFGNQLLTESTFNFLAELGMFFLLFIIGFEINLKTIIKQEKEILKTTIYVIFLEILFGTILLYHLFDLTLFMAIIVSSSFATVGEAVLLPILNEFNLTKKKIGQRILSIGILDDIFEILVIIIVSMIVGNSGNQNFSILLNLGILLLLFILVYILFEVHNNIQNFKYKDTNSLFLFVLFFIFLFVGIGSFIDSASLGALLAGVSLRNLVPQTKLDFIENEIKVLSYGFLAPMFFVWVGLSLNLESLFNNIELILFVVIVTLIAKVLGAVISSKKEFGLKKSIFMGLGLTVKLSTGIVVLSILLENNLITEEIFSILIGASIIFTISIPIILPILIRKWKMENS